MLVPPDGRAAPSSGWPAEGDYTVSEPIARIAGRDAARSPTRGRCDARGPAGMRLDASVPLSTGQRALDLLFPVARGSTAAVPGGFGTGKTVLLQQIAKWCDADVIVYVSCGERGNELADVLHEIATLEDPRTGRSLLDRTVLVANTSNMPLMAREASVYAGVTVAELYRDMGYDALVIADSTSRWAEALREIASRTGELPAEEGYPASLAPSLASFYERAARVQTLGGDVGSVTILGAVSPPGGDMAEPVTAHTRALRARVWSLDRDLAYARHYPAVSWRGVVLARRGPGGALARRAGRRPGVGRAPRPRRRGCSPRPTASRPWPSSSAPRRCPTASGSCCSPAACCARPCCSRARSATTTPGAGAGQAGRRCSRWCSRSTTAPSTSPAAACPARASRSSTSRTPRGRATASAPTDAGGVDAIRDALLARMEGAGVRALDRAHARWTPSAARWSWSATSPASAGTRSPRSGSPPARSATASCSTSDDDLAVVQVFEGTDGIGLGGRARVLQRLADAHPGRRGLARAASATAAASRSTAARRSSASETREVAGRADQPWPARDATRRRAHRHLRDRRPGDARARARSCRSSRSAACRIWSSPRRSPRRRARATSRSPSSSRRSGSPMPTRRRSAPRSRRAAPRRPRRAAQHRRRPARRAPRHAAASRSRSPSTWRSRAAATCSS